MSQPRKARTLLSISPGCSARGGGMGGSDGPALLLGTVGEAPPPPPSEPAAEPAPALLPPLPPPPPPPSLFNGGTEPAVLSAGFRAASGSSLATICSKLTTYTKGWLSACAGGTLATSGIGCTSSARLHSSPLRGRYSRPEKSGIWSTLISVPEVLGRPGKVEGFTPTSARSGSVPLSPAEAAMATAPATGPATLKRLVGEAISSRDSTCNAARGRLGLVLHAGGAIDHPLNSPANKRAERKKPRTRVRHSRDEEEDTRASRFLPGLDVSPG